MNKFKYLSCLAVAFSTTSANAAFITVHDNLGSAYLSQGQSVNGVFDLGAAVPKSNYQHYAINSATLTFSLSDDSDSTYLSYTSTGGYYYTHGSNSYWYKDSSKRWRYDNDYYERIRYDYYYEQGESGRLSVGDQQVNRNDSDYYSHQNGAYVGGYSLTSSNWVYVGDYCDESYFGICTDYDPSYRVDQKYHRTIDYDRYYRDSITGTAFGLSAINIADLAQDGLLGFNFQATYGDLYFNSAYLTLDVEVVPEPSILALMGTGIAGIGFMRRRRKIQTNTL